jgi:hypothetical protein
MHGMNNIESAILQRAKAVTTLKTRRKNFITRMQLYSLTKYLKLNDLTPKYTQVKGNRIPRLAY